MEHLERVTASHGVTMVGRFSGPVSFGFTERAGGVSPAPYDSLNLGGRVGDDPARVAENRRRVLEALGIEDALPNLIEPHQVHGARVLTVSSADPADLALLRRDAARGCDGVVCTAPGVPVLLCFADCVPIVLTAPRGFAVLHSGWRGTYARIASVGARALAEAAGCDMAQVRAFIGPHILGDEYEVSPELMERFAREFSCVDASSGRLLDLSACIVEALAAAGVPAGNVLDTALSTMSLPGRFFSYRASGGRCGRHAAVACLR